MKNNIAQTLIGLACSAVLVVGSASIINAKTTMSQKDDLSISDDGIYDIRVADDLIGIKSADVIGFACDSKLIVANKLTIDDKITIGDKIVGDDEINISGKIVGRFTAISKVAVVKAVSDVSRPLDYRIVSLAKFGQVEVTGYSLKSVVSRSIA